MNTAPREKGLAARAIPIKDDPLLGPDGRVWPALLQLWVYSALSGACAIGLGEVMVAATRSMLPAQPMRLSAVIATVVAAGLAAENVLGRMKELIYRRS